MASFKEWKLVPKVIYAIFLYDEGSHFFDIAFDKLDDALKYQKEIEEETIKANKKTQVTIHRCEEVSH